MVNIGKQKKSEMSEKGAKTKGAGKVVKRMKKLSEYGKQLLEKQKVKEMYGMRERQFKRFFEVATKSEGAPGENLLNLLERRLDNVLYRLKLANTRCQARQVIVHGHVLVNGKKVYAPSYWVSVGEEISLAPNVLEKGKFLEQVVDKRLNIGVKVPEWLELVKKDRKGNVLRLPVRADIQAPIEEYLIVELYSK
ncbi:TPA: 30S ribosomal protein S4 [Candidatus Dependentiae bacterium]|nr:MAG: 30S ribosomal protein S4 [candidate division TM6 bacterium GW2011_GWF2_36_131]KKQ03060.1 MAG: 30S ribosomal protein S4 [candidate division TM6 bacterium GW2011_GWE2_36_25]KKQ19627.1 MAG: 30S ribosomal protein S4 [candidate division TM6 bacterium GW2011_GWA2_36_9]HBR71142.1 30S ribosomal protein S4 [Candidatus Dependentiae bacterium]HCU00481.1 30S ribosomal protein S4 [Candidatus Dependentiae bacterium]